MARPLDRVPGIVLVSVAAAMWGLDGLIRKPLSDSTSAFTIVFGEHVVLVALTLPLLIPAMRALFRAGPAYMAAGVAVGAGASASRRSSSRRRSSTATSSRSSSSSRSQPLIVVVGAWLVLKEQPRPASRGSCCRLSPVSG